MGFSIMGFSPRFSASQCGAKSEGNAAQMRLQCAMLLTGDQRAKAQALKL
jgi:hypothetical protein